MNADGWREIQNVTADYLKPGTGFTVITTRLKKTDSKTYKAMYAWCRENVEGSWGPSCLLEYDYFITWRFWRSVEREAFRKKFKRFIK